MRYGRVDLPLSMRLRETGESLVAELGTVSSWKHVGEWKHGSGRMRAGMVMSSGIRDVSTEALWEDVKFETLSKEATA